MAARLGLSLLATAATTILVATSPAAAQRATHLSWSERFPYHGPVVMTFQVSNISVTATGWSANISFHNLSKKTVTVSGNSFGIAYYKSEALTPTTKPTAFGVATSFSHVAPVKLAPDATWSGVIKGKGKPTVSGKTWARIVFGPFSGVPGGQKVFIWITDHSLPLTLGKKSSGSGGLVI